MTHTMDVCRGQEQKLVFLEKSECYCPLFDSSEKIQIRTSHQNKHFLSILSL